MILKNDIHDHVYGTGISRRYWGTFKELSFQEWKDMIKYQEEFNYGEI